MPSPAALPVPTAKPFVVPPTVNVWPEAIRVVWKPLVCPYVSEPTVRLLSTTLSTDPAETAPPVSLNCTSLVEVGAPVGVQFPVVDQLVFTPAGVQTFPGVGAPTLYVKTLMSPAVKSDDPANVLAPVTVT